MTDTQVSESPKQGRVLPVTDLSLVVLVGASGSGKSTFAGRHFKPTEVISSDFCRGLVADDENDQSASRRDGAPSSTRPACSRTPDGS